MSSSILLTMDIILIALTGLTIGFLSSFFGIGGGSLIVPLLYTLYPMLSDEQVIGTSLITIFFLSSNNTYRYFELKALPPKNIIVNFLISASIGALLGARLTYLIDTNISKKIIASVLVLVVIKLFLSPNSSENQNGNNKLNPIKIFLTGFFGAFISSISGLGGGVIFIPLLISFAKVPFKSVSPYSNLVMVMATLMGGIPHLFNVTKTALNFPLVLSFFFLGNINFAIVAILISAAFLTSNLGVKYNERIDPKVKRYLLASLLLILSVKMFLA